MESVLNWSACKKRTGLEKERTVLGMAALALKLFFRFIKFCQRSWNLL